MPVLTAAGLRAGYRGRTVLEDVDLAYDPGVHVLLGPNGAGKTTLFRVLAAVLRPTAGTVRVAGRDPHADRAAKSLLGVCAHRAALAPRLSVADNLRFWARVLRLSPDDREGRVAEVMAAMDLTDIRDQRAGTLSRGQAQRVGIAKALLGRPRVLLLDEPTSGVDPRGRARLRTRLRALAADGHTILTSTHDLGEAGELADDVTVLYQGRVVGRGTPSQLRQGLVAGGRLRVRLRGRQDLCAALTGLGYAARPHPQGGAVVEVRDETETEDLVARLVRAGIPLREVSPATNLLEDVLLHLDDGTGNAGA
ncbi:daunorubicin resistance protein DrrA family ABC transporter ATP-binding protein [Streptomyces fumigatiscleroticus]|nr:daunorubicin resistance protein DrrA family ABC transporter ATP-binding protein [Streptomyces fumigatiscleroticus]